MINNQIQKIFKDKYFLIILIIFFITLLLFLRAWVIADGVSYYSYLPSVFYDHSLNFYNEFQFYSTLSSPWLDFAREYFIKDGIVMHYFAVGPAVLALPFYFLVWIIIKILAVLGIYSLSSHLDFLPYLLSFNIASAFYGIMGLLIAYKFANQFFSKQICFWSVLAIWLGSSIINYFYFEASFAHTFTLFGVGLFIYYWWNTYQKRKFKEWFVLGLIGGIMALTRWQEVTFLVLPIIELVIKNKKLLGTLKNSIIFILGFIIAFSPQIAVWKLVYGQYLIIPQGSGFLHYFNPQIISVLFSSKHGLITWTPIIFLALAGLYFLYKKEKTLTIYLIICFLLQLYVNSIAEDWWGGFAFGQRRFIDLSLVFVLGLSAMFDFLRQKISGIFYKGVAIFFIVWNFLFLIQYRAHLIDGGEYINFQEMILNQFTLAPFNVIKLLGQSTFLTKLFTGIKNINFLEIMTALAIFMSYILVILLLVYSYKLINRKVSKKGVK